MLSKKIIEPFLLKKTIPSFINSGFKFNGSKFLNFEKLKLPTLSKRPEYFNAPKLFWGFELKFWVLILDRSILINGFNSLVLVFSSIITFWKVLSASTEF